ncbi:MAG TPA: LysR substrate-binding domain-containing protein, partial [Alteraurantiacibacter sp.]
SHFFTIAAPREFYAQWLAAKLAEFRKVNSEARFQLIGGDDVDFTEANLDIAVRLAEGPGELEGVQIAPAKRVLVAAKDAPDEWIEWPGMTLPEGAEALLQVGNAGQALASALAGLGRTRLPLLLAEQALERGELVALEEAEDCRRAYWLIAPRPQWRQKKVKALVEFLSAQ